LLVRSLKGAFAAIHDVIIHTASGLSSDAKTVGRELLVKFAPE